MARFVDVPVENAEVISVNPERVAYIRKQGDHCKMVFEGFAGGLHDKTVMMPREQLVKLLSKEPASKAPAAPSQAKAKPAKAAT